MTTFRTRSLIGVVTVAVATSAAVGVGVAAAVGRSVDHGDSSSYGSLPAYLPSSSLRPDSELVGTVARPALTSEGDAVRAMLPHGSVRATVFGPVVPGEGLPYEASTDTATWEVTLSHVVGTVPISPAAFSTIDSRGEIYHPSFVPGQPRPPLTLGPGQSAHFELRVVMAVGEGMMRWAPEHDDLLATWDFVVEND